VSLLILVVDDEPDVEVLFRQQFRRDLRSGRFSMEFAQSAPAALECINRSTLLRFAARSIRGSNALRDCIARHSGRLLPSSGTEREMAKKYPVLYAILVWIGIAAFGFTMFYGMYILSFLPEIPASDGEARQTLIEVGAAIVAIGAASLNFLGISLWRNRSHRDVATPTR
jgi:CheY-like chemotaxis protein